MRFFMFLLGLVISIGMLAVAAYDKKVVVHKVGECFTEKVNPDKESWEKMDLETVKIMEVGKNSYRVEDSNQRLTSRNIKYFDDKYSPSLCPVVVEATTMEKFEEGQCVKKKASLNVEKEEWEEKEENIYLIEQVGIHSYKMKPDTVFNTFEDAERHYVITDCPASINSSPVMFKKGDVICWKEPEEVVYEEWEDKNHEMRYRIEKVGKYSYLLRRAGVGKKNLEKKKVGDYYRLDDDTSFETIAESFELCESKK